MVRGGNGKYLRTNYRITGGYFDDIGVFDSHIVLLTLGEMVGTLSMDENPKTVSMVGYGKPSWIAVVGMTIPKQSNSSPIFVKASGDFSGSIGWLHFYMSTTSYTGTLNLDVLALIGSR